MNLFLDYGTPSRRDRKGNVWRVGEGEAHEFTFRLRPPVPARAQAAVSEKLAADHLEFAAEAFDVGAE